MNFIPCNGDFWLYSPIHDGDQVISIYKVPIIAWAVNNEVLYPVPADEPWSHEDDEIIVKDGTGYSVDGDILKSDDDFMKLFQGRRDREIKRRKEKEERERQRLNPVDSKTP